MSVKRTGKWNKVSKQLASHSKVLEETIKKASKKIGLVGEGIVVDHMQNQDLNWEPLSESTQAKKAREGTSEKILIQTSSYFQSVTSFVDSDETIHVGVKKGTLNKDGEPIDIVAAVHEYGSAKMNIPARPLFEPSLEELTPFFKQIMSKAIENSLKKSLGF